MNLDYICVCVADGLAYSALLKNELLGAGIEKIQDPQTEDRRLQPSTPEKRSLFSVWTSHLTPLTVYTELRGTCITSEQRQRDYALGVLNRSKTTKSKSRTMKLVENIMSALVFFTVFTQHRNSVSWQWHQHLPILPITCQQQEVMVFVDCIVKRNTF